MDCRQVRSALGRRRDGEAPGCEEGALDAHVASCPDCARAVAAMDAVSDWFAAFPDREAPAGLNAKVKERIRSREGRLLSLRPLLRNAAAAAAVLLLSTGSLLVLTSPPRPVTGAASLTADAALTRLLSRIAEDHAPALAEEGPR